MMFAYMLVKANDGQCREANDDQQFTQRWLFTSRSGQLVFQA